MLLSWIRVKTMTKFMFTVLVLSAIAATTNHLVSGATHQAFMKNVFTEFASVLGSAGFVQNVDELLDNESGETTFTFYIDLTNGIKCYSKFVASLEQLQHAVLPETITAKCDITNNPDELASQDDSIEACQGLEAESFQAVSATDMSQLKSRCHLEIPIRHS